MAKAQGAVCLPSGDYAIYLTLTLGPDRLRRDLRRACAGLPKLTEALAKESGEKRLVSAVAIGARAWPKLFRSKPPAGLVPFGAIREANRNAPATPADLFVHIHSNRHAANFALAQRFIERVGASAKLVEEVHGFRNLQKRDFIGFVDGTENPKGKEIPEVTLVGKENKEFAGGSYVSLQRYVHSLDRWRKLTVRQQENVIGRTKKDNIEMDDRRKPPTAHIARAVIEENGKELEIFRQGLTYGTLEERGTYFIAYGRTPRNFRLMLERLMRADGAGHYDHLMNFYSAKTGANFFAPSVDWLARQ